MRARLIVVFTIPGVLMFMMLGFAYAFSAARSAQQEVFLDRLADASYLVITARQSLTADDSSLVQGDLDRYRDVYEIDAAVLDQAGNVWASNGLDVTDHDERFAALAGRRSELTEQFPPWPLGQLVVAEPVFEGSDLVGAVVTASSTGRLARGLWLQWGALIVGGLVALVLAILIASRLARWVLRPVRMVDGAMAEIWRGHMNARIPESTGPPELRQVIDQFNSMAAKVEHVMHKQQEFVSNASHELRNPLNALLLRVEDLGLAIADSGAEPRLTEEIDSVREEGRRMAKILDALLMLARDQDLANAIEPVELGELVRRRVDGWQPLASDQGVEIRLAASDPVWAKVDEIVMESAFDAIADNAVKFSPAGSVIEVAIAGENGLAEVVVRDHGPGVPPDEVDNVADRFWRSPSHSTVRGSGLGLAIASELLDSCGGDVVVSLADGGGLQVTLRVPRHHEEARVTGP